MLVCTTCRIAKDSEDKYKQTDQMELDNKKLPGVRNKPFLKSIDIGKGRHNKGVHGWRQTWENASQDWNMCVIHETLQGPQL